MSENNTFEKYKTSLDMMRYEGDLLWKIFGNFLLVHTVFLAFLVQNLFSKSLFVYRSEIFIAGIIGIVISIPWISTYLRSSSYYILRMLQARESEPDDWNIIKNIGEKFSAGEEVEVSGEKIRVHFLGRIFRTKRSVPILLFVFLFFYLLTIIISGPWW